MKMLEIPFKSKHIKVLKEAHIYIKKVTDFAKKARKEMGEDAKKSTIVYVSESTI